MKKITLKDDNTFEHFWPLGNAPDRAIDVEDSVAIELSQNPQAKKYDPATQTVSDYVPAFVVVDALNNKRNEINTASKSVFDAIVSQYTREEIDSWTIQEAEASAWLADNLVETPLIDGMAANRPSIDKAELVRRILANAASYKTFSGTVIGKKQAFEDRLNALNPATATQADIDAIEVIY